jgi:citrate lyase subunit beta / citryl-CoA lyase
MDRWNQGDNMIHPDDVLLEGERSPPVLPACEHFAGTEKLIGKALELQARLGSFDVTMDCEDGAQAGDERRHAEMIVAQLRSPSNGRKMAGVRIHDPTHPAWRADLDIVVAGAGDVLAYVTVPKVTTARQVDDVLHDLQACARRAGVVRPIPVHVLIETHGALRDVWAIAALPGVQTLDFGLMDFVSAHGGAIPEAAMRSPGQFEHRLLVRAKSEVCAAALAHGVVPAHNVTLDLKNADQTFADARRARTEFGFLRMWSIHPAQIDAIVKAMAPDFADVARACEILLAAEAKDWGPIQHGGQLHDRGTYRSFWQLVQRARLAGIALPPDAEATFFGTGGGA